VNRITDGTRAGSALQLHPGDFLVGLHQFVPHFSQQLHRKPRLLESHHDLMDILRFTGGQFADRFIRQILLALNVSEGIRQYFGERGAFGAFDTGMVGVRGLDGVRPPNQALQISKS
jgi:hypothetical protein